MVSSTVGLAHHNGLETTGERRVLLDVLAVFVERGRADRVQVATGERRLEDVAGVHGTPRWHPRPRWCGAHR